MRRECQTGGVFEGFSSGSSICMFSYIHSHDLNTTYMLKTARLDPNQTSLESRKQLPAQHLYLNL